MNNNPMAAILSMMKAGKNPSAILSQLSQQNPMVGQALNMMSGKSADQLQQMAVNMARERGVNIEDLARSIGITIPSNR